MSYQNIFERMNRKEKRNFEKLPAEKKAEILSSEISKKFTASVRGQIENSVLVGYEMACRLFAENYVIKYLDEDDPEKAVEILNGLLGEIMRVYTNTKSKEKNQEEKVEE